ncbi:2-phospho-L-lactate guanylyltransferase [Ancylobacter sp. 6x-1]|uniref:3-phospho-D-glycerate guanylyltransferase n=1 Tax=Ancylobacter crimeensis TaxID=2579147 RepID=A0ABT0DBH9_9HYPH|nr:2-phospho-L-lactate guanylyltransferase [Ancylobacter crimeensis]MCK0197320.1 2-phospho-L-lactate guanylyltransferase [Ancylobacter crimeensis]
MSDGNAGLAGGLCAVVPVKAFDAAKSRLAEALPLAARPGLASAMLEDVLAALAAAAVLRPERLVAIRVVTSEPGAAAIAARHGAVVEPEAAPPAGGQGPEAGLNAAVDGAARRLAAQGTEGMLVLPADLPCITAAEIVGLIDAHGAGTPGRSPAVTLAPARAGGGTNALLASPPALLPAAYGPGSLARHSASASARGVRPRIHGSRGIALDIDTPDDLAALAGMQPGPCTARLLAGEPALAADPVPDAEAARRAEAQAAAQEQAAAAKERLGALWSMLRTAVPGSGRS